MKNQQVVEAPEPQFILTERSAFSAGKRAYRALILRTGNPYGEPYLAQAWNRGFTEAASEDSLSTPVMRSAQQLQRKFSRAHAA